MTGPFAFNGVPRVAFWDAVSPGDRESLVALGVPRVFPTDAEIMRQDDDARFVLVILRGCIKVVANDTNGYQAVLALRYAGDVVGEMASLDDVPRSAGIHAVGEVQALLLRSAEFRDFIKSHRDAFELLQRCISARLREADQYRTAATRPVPERLAAVLLDIAGRNGRLAADGSLEIDLPLTQDDLAGLLSVSRRTVSRAMEAWRREEVVTTGRRSIVIRAPERLAEIAG